MADAGHRAEAQHHLLIDVEDGNQQQQRPQQRRAVVLAGLGIGAERAGVIVADHDDQAGAEDREQGLQLAPPAAARACVMAKDRSERALDVADMGLIEDGGIARRRLRCGWSWLPPGRCGAEAGRLRG